MTDLDSPATRYLLGEMADAERAAFEDALLADDALHEQVRATEDDLFDAHAAGALPAPRRQRFEQVFLGDPGGVQRLEIARALQQRAQTRVAPARARRGWTSWWRARWWAVPAFALGAAGVIAVVVLTSDPDATHPRAGPQVAIALVATTRSAPPVLTVPPGTGSVRLEPDVTAPIERATLRRGRTVVPSRLVDGAVIVDSAALVTGRHQLEVVLRGEPTPSTFELMVER